MSARTPPKRSLAIVLFVAALGQPAANAQNAAPPHDLIRAPRSIPAHVNPPRAANIVRSRLVAIDLGPMGHRRATKDVATPVQARLHLDLFDGARLRTTLRRVTAGGGEGQVFEGDVDGSPGSSTVFAVHEGQLFGNIRSGDRWYQIRYVEEGLHAVIEMDESAMPASLEPVAADAAGPAAAADATAVAADDGSIIDVLVMYTPSVKTAVGGSAGVTNLINTAIAETNSAYQNSGVTQRLRLVHSAETANWLYNGSPVNADNYAFRDALTLLQQSGDGAMDAAHTLRDTHGADAVALIINRSDVCGVAYVMRNVSNAFQSSAFSVSSWQCATGYYSFGHELGHNMGLAHDRANESNPGAFSYAYGWQNPNGIFRTVMAYSCPGGCTRIPYFSNPTVTYNGAPTGSPLGTATEAHNALAVNNTAATFANFRQSVSATCSYSLSSTSVSFGAAGGTQSVDLTSGPACAWTTQNFSGFITLAPLSGAGPATISVTVQPNSGPARSASVIIAGIPLLVTQAAASLPVTGFDAHATAPNAVLLTWNAFPGATSYEVYRRAPGGGVQFLNNAPGAAFTDSSVTAGTAYQYRVRAQTPGGFSEYSAYDVAVAALFSDDPLVSQSTPIRGVHVTELRTAVNAMRALANLPAASFTDPDPAGAAVKVAHITELRNALTEARAALSMANAAYAAGAGAGNSILAVHFQELRDRIE